MRLHVLVPETHPIYHKFTLSESMLDGWKKTLRQEKRRMRKDRLQKLLRKPLLWAHFNATCVEVDTGDPVATSCLDQAAIVLAATKTGKGNRNA